MIYGIVFCGLASVLNVTLATYKQQKNCETFTKFCSNYCPYASIFNTVIYSLLDCAAYIANSGIQSCKYADKLINKQY